MINERDIAYRQDLQQRLQTFDQEHVQLETKISKNKKLMEQKTKELRDLQSKLTTTESQAKQSLRSATEKQDELKKTKSALVHLRNQYEVNILIAWNPQIQQGKREVERKSS